MIVYADILIVINAALNYAILMTADRLLKRGVRLLRLLAGALVGSLFSLAVFIDVGSTILLFLFKLLSTAVITLTTFGFRGIREYLKAGALTLTVSTLYSGGLILFYQLFKPPDMLIVNDIPYFAVDPLSLLLLTSVIYLVLLLLAKLFSERIKASVVPLSFKVSDKEYSCVGKLDTGCNLTEPFSGSPVIIVDRSIYSPEEGGMFRIIPYSTLDNSSYLKAVKAQSVSVDRRKIDKSVYIASADIRSGSYEALINYDIIR